MCIDKKNKHINNHIAKLDNELNTFTYVKYESKAKTTEM